MLEIFISFLTGFVGSLAANFIYNWLADWFGRNSKH